MNAVDIPATLDGAALDSLSRALDEAAAQMEPVLRIEASAGARGLDVAGVSRLTSSEQRASIDRFAALVLRIAEWPRPTVAWAGGVCLGGGLGLLCACDHVAAAADARFGLPEALYGIAPAVVWPVLRVRTGPRALRALALMAATVDANEARAIGLCDAVVIPEERERALSSVARRLRRAATPSVLALRQLTSPADEVNSGAALLARLLDGDAGREVARRWAAIEAGEAPWA